MRQLRYVDYDCPNCEATCTRFVYFDTDAGAPIDAEICEEVMYTYDDGLPATCDGVLVPREMSGVGYVKVIVKGNSDFNERERARLEKRQDDHWRRKGLDEAVDRDRAFSKKHGVAPGFK